IGEANRHFYSAFGVDPRKLFDTPYSVDNDFFLGERARVTQTKSQLKADLGIADDAAIVCFSGKLIERQRPLDLARAYRKLRQAGQNAALVFIGDGPLRANLEQTVREQQLTDVVFAGFRNQCELAPIYAASDIFVLPARFETWGLVVNEAMLFDLPVA